jgi:tRNA G18 (ribose-2'-O)-methylase SpoU
MRKLTHDEISARRVTKDDITDASRPPIYVLLDNIRSLYNVGSIFRTSDGALVRKLYLCGFTPHPPRKEIEKTALGATATVPWEYHRNPLDPLRTLKQQGVRICVLEQTTSSIPYTSVTREAFPLCLVIGNEITGVSPEVIAEGDLAAEIPMHGTKQSLNAAVAYGVAVFELLRIWNGR